MSERDLVSRLLALARAGHDDLSIGDEAAAEITRLRDENTELRRLQDGIALMLRDEQIETASLRERVRELEAVERMARQAYRVDAVAEWFDAEGDGLKSALDAIDRARGAKP